jgi:predicted dehydrogenase
LAAPDVQVLAICDVDHWRRDNAQATVESAYGGAQRSGTYRGCTTYRDLREMLARDDIDAVVIATGDRWHVPSGVLAAQAGKDIYCEKPMSLTIHEARVMAQVARRYGCVFQTGLQQRSMPEFRRACQLIQDGHVGRVRAVHVSAPGTSGPVNLPAEPVPDTLDWDLWLGPAPWRPFNHRFHHVGRPRHVVPWNFCRDFAGGSLTANTVHAFDIVQWALGMDESGPIEIIPPETGTVPSLTYRYADGVELQVHSRLESGKHFVPAGWNVETPIQMFGALFVGDDGWIHVGRYGYLQSYPETIVGTDTFPSTHPVDNHHRNWLNCIRSRQRPVCDVACGAASTIVSHLGCIAHWTGRALKWDPVREEFLDGAQANQLRSRTMREPWCV